MLRESIVEGIVPTRVHLGRLITWQTEMEKMELSRIPWEDLERVQEQNPRFHVTQKPWRIQSHLS